MPTRADLELLAKAQNHNVEFARRDLDKLWKSLQGLEPDKQRNALLKLIPELVSKYGDVAGTAAAEWYEQAREADLGKSDFIATIGEGYPSEAVQDSIRWQAGVLWDDPQQMQRFLNNSIDRWVKYCGRATIMENVRHDSHKVKWALVPQGKTCAFCTMLASNGFHYERKYKAQAAQHANCDCWPCPSFKSRQAFIQGYDPDKLYNDYQEAREELARARKGEGPYAKAFKDFEKQNPHKDATASGRSAEVWMMRHLKPDEYKDGVHTDVRMTSDQSLSYAIYKDYRSSLAERFIAANNPKYKMPPETPVEAPKDWPKDLPQLRAKEWNHILYGDREKVRNSQTKEKEWNFKGGHSSGFGWITNGDEFPSSWKNEDILNAIEHTVGNTSSDGLFTSTYKGVKIQVIVRKGKVITAYRLGR
ncbi:hypothetical protein EJ419_07290 [Alloscardovia theropitheci]|uniref:Uncharacterized protein n=1 Tax=Alloscardovia theropitheci TaxID=2496842 RepID=A0A4R0QNI7_9BIFI|nr:EndoU domain-containing protein [Alloscardovia theropitheci]TCD53762.1 hypothetical protein EJ419_07290 [Alloscardovia theropitheci]